MRIKDTTNGVITDMDGRYTITAPGKNSILVISYIGYSTEEVKINDRRNINIRLREDTKALDEVVVVGYGQQKGKCSCIHEFRQSFRHNSSNKKSD